MGTEDTPIFKSSVRCLYFIKDGGQFLVILPSRRWSLFPVPLNLGHPGDHLTKRMLWKLTRVTLRTGSLCFLSLQKLVPQTWLPCCEKLCTTCSPKLPANCLHPLPALWVSCFGHSSLVEAPDVCSSSCLGYYGNGNYILMNFIDLA